MTDFFQVSRIHFLVVSYDGDKQGFAIYLYWQSRPYLLERRELVFVRDEEYGECEDLFVALENHEHRHMAAHEFKLSLPLTPEVMDTVVQMALPRKSRISGQPDQFLGKRERQGNQD